MRRVVFSILLFASLLATPIRGVQTVGAPNGGFDITPPTNSDITNWVTIGNTEVPSWGPTGVTGWNYVGQIGSASGTYLGNGWVLTAGHVALAVGGVSDFKLGNVTYMGISGTGQYIDPDNATGTSVDLYLFKIADPPPLPQLTISLTLPTAFSATQTGSSVAMLGFGGGQGLTWGLDTVTETDQVIDLTQPPNNLPFVSNDFQTDNGITTYGSSSIDNMSTLVGGDSGGGDFTWDGTKWELTGINEVNGDYDNNPSETYSGMVQLDTYASQINEITGLPEPKTWMLLGLGLAFIWVYSRRRFPVRK